MKKTGTKLVSLLLAFALLLLTSCAGNSENNSSSDSGTTEGDAIDVIEFGALYPLSGNQANTGAECINGIEFALEIVNNSYDLDLPCAENAGIASLGGAKLEAITGDTQGVAEKGMSVAEEILTSNENAVGIIGCYNSAVAVTIAQVTEKMGKAFICPDCTSPSLTENGFKNFYRLTPIDTTFVENMIGFLLDMNAEKGADLKTVASVF